MAKKIKILTVFGLVIALLFVNSGSLFANTTVGEIKLDDSSVDIKEQRDIMTASGVNQDEQNIDILRKSGISEDILTRLDKNKIDQMFQNALSIDTQIFYLKSDEDHIAEIVTEEECMTAVKTHEASRASNSGTDNEFPDEYLRVTLSRVYLDPESQEGEKGWYMLYTWFDWLTVPQKRLLDAFSVASLDFDWETLDDCYSELTYNAMDVNDRIYHFEVKSPDDFRTRDNGYYYLWDLPEDKKSDSYVFTSCHLYSHAKCRIKNPDVSRNISIYVKYIHIHPLTGKAEKSDYIWTDSDFMGIKLNKAVMLKTQYELLVDCQYDDDSTN